MSPAAKSPSRRNDASGRTRDGRPFEAGVRAYEQGDWKSARRLLGDAVESEERKQNRLRAAEILGALSLDRFALGLAAVLGAVLLGVFLLAVR